MNKTMNTSEAKIHALNARALSAEIDMMKIHDLNEIANDRGPHTSDAYQGSIDALYQVEQDIYAVIRDGWL
jgi:hypothetical protein